VIPSVAEIRRKFTKRRQGLGTLDRLLRRLLGLDQKMAQYRDGAVFVRSVIDTVGMDGFNAVWAEPANLPSKGLGADTTTVLVGCSGGADSLALLAATVFETRRDGVRVVGVVVDHGLQDDSAGHTARVVDQMAALGVDETASIRVTVDPGPAGIEAGARQARYAALRQLAVHFAADLVLLGHTLDDQAETVLLGLTHGSGGRSLAGMRRAFTEDGVTFARPLLDVSREQTRAACEAEGIGWWEDPHNADPRFVRSRIRHTVLPVLERELGPGVAEALARTADQVRADVDHLDDLADAALAALSAQVAASSAGASTRPGLPIAGLAGLAPPVRTRVLRLAALAAGAPAAELFAGHVREVERLVTDWRGQRWVDLPGHLRAVREGDLLVLRRAVAG
jgi:tRNA(Ile)-lysidine synthase